MSRVIALSIRFFLVFLLSVPPLFAATAIESGGIVVIEAESVSARGDWSRERSISGAKGGAYLRWTGPDLFNKRLAGRDTLTYRFRVLTAGNYELRWRSYIAHGSNSTESNDSWVRFPSGRNIGGQHALDGWTKVYQNSLGRWSWTSKTVDHVGKPIRQYFSKGTHTIEVSGRSFGHAIDRITLYRYQDVTFSESVFNALSGSNTPPSPPPAPAPEPAPTVEEPAADHLYL